MSLCKKYIQRYGFRQFSLSCQCLSNQPYSYKPYKNVEIQKKGSMEPMEKWDMFEVGSPWNEKFELMKYVRSLERKAKHTEFLDYRDEMIMRMQRLRVFFYYKGELTKYFKKKVLERQLLLQSFFERRIAVLGPDIGVAHFIVARNGKIKFWGHKDWITHADISKKLPSEYIPGLYIVAIDATGTDLYYEGVDCLRYLNKLKWLRLRGLKNLNDFSLDIISGRYGSQLEYLDLTDCTGITHYGLSCFYRFKCLKGLNLTGLNHTPEFVLSCLMIHDLLPDLDIIGVDFSRYLKDEKQKGSVINIVGEVSTPNV